MVADIRCLGGTLICAVDIRGLVKVMSEHGAGDRAMDYYINVFAIDHYSNILIQRPHRYPAFCRTLLFMKTH